ncbi:DUF4376 domain-containing protein [Devosia sp. ZB163]|uniref:DUF4376 domain-containing protein n=1 Tax=Devosia sp. ZB163 TaxID=3025938 RepID=UPI00235FD623|nr:DUF4376 domain-containing protein [Devosia sp. ZB163]MDC9825685.1 DUF4376 domain-containing protein [Devosia sp. ZB163]
MDRSFSPHSWFWVVAGDETRYWSSEAVAYVTELPEGAGVTRIGSEAELSDVLRVHGIQGPLVSKDDLYAERERRIALPLAVTLSVGTIQINMDALSQRNIQGLASVGQYLSAASPEHMTAFRGFDNVTYQLTAADLVSMGLQVAARIQAAYNAEWALKAMDPVPLDYQNDRYWK